MSRPRQFAAGGGRARAPLGAPHDRAAAGAPGRVQPHWTHRALAEHLREGLCAAASQHAKFGAYVLGGMSDQISMLGPPHEALQLATAGRHGLACPYSLACAADLWAMQARAHAALGESRDDEPEWAQFIDTAYRRGLRQPRSVLKHPALPVQRLCAS